MFITRIMALVFFILFIAPAIYSYYRPYDFYVGGARAAGAGATGVSAPDSAGSMAQNPAYLSEIETSAFAIAFDAQTRITRLQTDVNIQPEFIPLLNIAWPVKPNSGAGLIIQSPFQRRFPDSRFINYNIEAAFAHSISRSLNLGVSGGPAIGIENEQYQGWGFGYSVSMLYHNEHFRAGLLVRPGTKLNYSVFSTGKPVEEKLPDLYRAGISKRFNGVLLSLEVDYIDFNTSAFIHNSVATAPDFKEGYFGYLQPHIGASFSLPWWPGLIFRGGVHTENFYDYQGNNERQVLLSLGFGGLAGAELWGERLRIDFSWVSSFIPSVLFEENNQIEKAQVTFEFIY